MLSKIKSSYKLYLLIVVMSVFIVGIGGYGIHELQIMNRNTHTLYADRVSPLDQLTTVRFSYSGGILSSAEQLNARHLSFSETMKEVENAEKKIQHSWQAYKHTYFSPGQDSLAQQLEELMVSADKTIKKLKVIISKKDTIALDKLVNKELYTAVNPVLSKVNELIQFQLKVSSELRQKNEAIYDNATTRFYLLILASLIFAFALSFFLVDDIKQLISNLRESNVKIISGEKKYSSLLEQAGDAIFILNEDKHIIHLNDRACTLLGYSKNELINMSITELVPVEELGKQADYFKLVKENNNILTERILKRKDGTEIETEVNTRVLEGEGYIGIIRDISERKKAELAIKKSEEKYRSLVEHAGDGICLIADDTSILDVNERACELTGYTRDELLSKKGLELYSPEDLAANPIRWDILNKNKTFLNETRILRKDGSKLEVEISRKVLPDGGYLAIVRDITERKHMQELLAEQKEKLVLFIEHSPVSIAMFDTDLKYIATSKRWIIDYKLEGQELIGKSHYQIFPNLPQRWKDIHQRVLRGNIEKAEEDYFIRPDGSKEWLRWEIHPWHKANGEIGGIIMFTDNITERKQATEWFKYQFENSPDTIILINKFYKILALNRSVDSDWPVTKLVGMHCLTIVPKQSKQVAEETIRKCFETGQNQEIEIIFRLDRVGSLRFVPIVTDGEVSHIMIITTDITERKAAEEKLRESEERYKSIIAVSNTGAWEYHLDKDYLWCSPEYFSMLGRDLADYDISGSSNLKETWIDLLHPDDRIKSKEHFVQYLKNGSVGTYESYFRMQHLNGSWVWIWSRGQTLRDANGNITDLTVGTHIDITERIYAENEKQEIQKKAMLMLEDKVVERTEELYKTNLILELRNHEIIDSINYAQNIQRAILSKSEDCHKIFPDSSVLWMPKDAVSGDFYWCYSNNKYGFLALVDCTGHGVPGALMSIIANQLLDRVVNTYGFVNPKEILFHLDDAIINSLKQETGLVKDGMDIVICRLDKENKKLIFAGAQRPLFHYDGVSLKEIEGNKFGVGGFLSSNHLKKFTQTEIEYKKGDCIYLTSDGYYSQFGGDKRKKMMKKRFKEYILTIADRPVEEQEKLLRNFYTEWQGNEEQVDDVLVIIVRL